jgi:hypothetical protein
MVSDTKRTVPMADYSFSTRAMHIAYGSVLDLGLLKKNKERGNKQ